MTKDPIGAIARSVGLSARDVVRIVADAPTRYRVYGIPKRNGRGERIIAHPSKPLKIIQRHLVSEYLLPAFSISSSAFAYRKGVGIRANAEAHAKSNVILKMDFKDFFHSIVPADLLQRAPRQIQENDTLRKLLQLSLFWHDIRSKRLCLSIGAPSSPIVSNIVMFQFDEAARTISEKAGVVYTRYADDLTFSGESAETLERVELEIRQLVADTKSPRLELNEDKRGLYTRAMKRMVTGVKITPEGKVSLGRDRKRMISSAVFKAKMKALSEADLVKTRGWLAFANSVEPEFLNRLRKKYGATVDNLLRMPLRPARF